MIFSGRIPANRSTRGKVQALSRCIAAFESEGCEVRRRGDLLEVGIPGPEHWLFPGLGEGALSGPLRWFWDRMELRVLEDGEIRYRMHYWSRSQALIHCMITSGLLADLLREPAREGWLRIIRLTLEANLLPAAMFYLFYIYIIGRLLRRLPS